MKTYGRVVPVYLPVYLVLDMRSLAPIGREGPSVLRLSGGVPLGLAYARARERGV